ncbi:MAG: type II secretion system protein [Patescibacteria group bacterium]
MNHELRIKEGLKYKLIAIRYMLKSSKGFTLVELILVIAVLSIMAVVLINLTNPVEQIRKANDARRKSDLAQIQKTLEAYLNDNGRYPGSSADYKISPAGTDVNWGTTWTAYKTAIPSDPSSSRYYVYYSNSIGQSYWLYTSLERGGKDPQACYSSGAVCANAGTANCGGTCNYGVSSPNTSP